MLNRLTPLVPLAEITELPLPDSTRIPGPPLSAKRLPFCVSPPTTLLFPFIRRPPDPLETISVSVIVLASDWISTP